jgi:hypothetical protein
MTINLLVMEWMLLTSASGDFLSPPLVVAFHELLMNGIYSTLLVSSVDQFFN